ncbi:MAG: undecaprenyl-phosphate glucose phosphotransferase [Flavobacterium sp.]|nr:MAG: undecaprenyl-phosphate glucose phosphotransferase [Flavobacterium sp.]
MDKQFLRYLQISFQLLDLFILNLVIFFAKFFFQMDVSPASDTVYFHFLIYLNITWLILSWLSGVYREPSISSVEIFTRKSKGLYIFWLCAVLLYLFFYRQFELSRFFIITTIFIFGLGIFLNRLAYIFVRDLVKEKVQLTKRIIIIGYNKVGQKLMHNLEKGVNNKIIGFVEDTNSITELTPYPILGNLDQTIDLSEKFQINHIFSTVSPEQNKLIYSLMEEAEAKFIRFRIIPDFGLFIKRTIYFEYFEGLPMLSLRSEPLEDIGNRIKKRIIDVAFSLFMVLFVLSWMIPLIGILIYLESPGPIFFSQLRSGKNNKPFRCLKFRSMTINKQANSVQATKGDHRITKIGKFIRRTSLDEFPQFLNVLMGEMSLVGPRPHMLKHTEEYSQLVDQYMIRQFLKPGITGWAQINGFRGEVKGHEEIQGRVDCDLWYSQNWTTWLDFRILLLTAYNIFKGEENAY